MTDHMASIGTLVYEGSQVAFGEAKRIVTGYPGAVPCSKCGIEVEPYDLAALFGWADKWAVVRLCHDGMDLEGVLDGKFSHNASCLEKGMRRDMSLRVASEAPEYNAARLAKSGLHAVEQGYPDEWHEQSLKGIPKDFVGLSPIAREHHPFFRYIWGSPGTGVSAQLALTVRHQITTHRRRSAMTSQARMFASLRVGGGKDTGDYIGLDFLSIDSFGQWRTDFEHESMAHIISERARLFRPTIFGSTMPLNGQGGGHTCVEDCAKRCWFESVWRTNEAIANTIITHCNGWRGITHLTQEHRPLPDTLSPQERSTYGQRLGNTRHIGTGEFS